MIEISRRHILVVLGGAAASAAVARVSLIRGPASSLVGLATGRRTSFGSVAMLAWSRLALDPSPERHHPHIGASADPSVPVSSAVHGAWTDAVVVDVEVRNSSRRPMALSPGQFRVRLDDGPTVSLYRADRPAGPVAAGSTTTMRISYLAPPRSRPLELEFDDAAAMRTLAVGRLDDPTRERNQLS